MAADKKQAGGKVKKKKTSTRWKNYKVAGGKLERKNSACPKCGSGVLLANHKDRLYCGNCHYVEMKKTDKK